MAKTFLGIIDGDYHEWADLSPELQEETFRIGQRQLAEMHERFDYDALDERARVSWRLFEYDKERARAGHPYREHVYTFNQMFGVQSRIPAFLVNQHRVTEPAHAEAYIDRLQGVDECLGQAIDNSRRRFELDIYPPRFVYAHVLRDAKNVIQGEPFREGAGVSPLLEDFRSKVDALTLLEEADRKALVERARQALLDPWSSARGATRGRHRAAGGERAQPRRRRRQGHRALHRHARSGDGLQDRHVEDPGTEREGPSWATPSTCATITTRCSPAGLCRRTCWRTWWRGTSAARAGRPLNARVADQLSGAASPPRSDSFTKPS